MERISGVKDIEQTELTYNSTKHYFEISITDTDGTTFKVDERSKGALWYLSFLMKTEFRRKKLRLNSGKPIFLIDEPASNLHSTAQQNMIADFQKLVEDTSVIYSTHSQYLISIENIKTTYIIERNEGKVSSTLWSDYIKKDTSNETYYQPLANLLNIIPNSFDIPWTKAIITEGPSDLKVLLVMFEVLHPKAKRKFTIYPGTSAQNLSSLISLNIGWSADFKVLLDSDKEGKSAQKKYIEEYNLDDSIIKILPIDNKKIEGYFTEEEKEKLYFLALNVEKKKISKKDFATVFSILNSTKEKKKKVKQLLSEKTITNFHNLINELV
ncbi:AAA family ATPase [Flavobacterium sp. ST-75]|uniref:AAA family ATPase n=1 Tax=Flavobacterium rhizophilum TaxID=3163296 RepID=A0ABW8YEV8_9FLAO